MPSPQAALVYAMVIAARSDRELAPEAIVIIGDLAEHLPIFCGIDRAQVAGLAARCSKRLAAPGGVEHVFGEIRGALPGRLREAAYALSCDVLALCRPLQGEQALESIRAQLEVDPATARTIERAAKARCPRPHETAPAPGSRRRASSAARPGVPLPS